MKEEIVISSGCGSGCGSGSGCEDEEKVEVCLVELRTVLQGEQL